MTNYKYIVGAILILVIGVLIGSVAFKGKTNVLGQVQNDLYQFTGGVQLGDGGVILNNLESVDFSSCTATASISATKTGTVECAVTGVKSDDTLVLIPRNTLSNSSLTLVGAYAPSTKNGYADIIFLNSSTTAIATASSDVEGILSFLIR